MGLGRIVARCICPCAQPSTLLTITDRLYLASYVEPPDANTVFPYPDPPRSPSKRSHRGHETQARQKQPYYFTVDDTLLYNAFHHDFGPLHIGHLYRFALQFHEILGADENKDRPIVFWSRADPRSMYPPTSPFTCSSPTCLPISMAVRTNLLTRGYLRPRQCFLLARVLHGSYPIVATPPRTGSDCAG